MTGVLQFVCRQSQVLGQDAGGGGPRWLTPANVTANLPDGGDYMVRHPPGL